MRLIFPDATTRARVSHHHRTSPTPNIPILHRPFHASRAFPTPRIAPHARPSRSTRAPPPRPPHARCRGIESNRASSRRVARARTNERTSSRDLDRLGAVHATEGALRGDERGGHRRVSDSDATSPDVPSRVGVHSRTRRVTVQYCLPTRVRVPRVRTFLSPFTTRSRRFSPV